MINDAKKINVKNTIAGILFRLTGLAAGFRFRLFEMSACTQHLHILTNINKTVVIKTFQNQIVNSYTYCGVVCVSVLREFL